MNYGHRRKSDKIWRANLLNLVAGASYPPGRRGPSKGLSVPSLLLFLSLSLQRLEEEINALWSGGANFCGQRPIHTRGFAPRACARLILHVSVDTREGIGSLFARGICFFPEYGIAQCTTLEAPHVWVRWFWAYWWWNHFRVNTNLPGPELFGCCAHQTRGI